MLSANTFRTISQASVANITHQIPEFHHDWEEEIQTKTGQIFY
jgi:hypothetical protein